MFKDVHCEKVKFADDGTIWKTGSNESLLAADIEKDLETVKKWTDRWRIKMNVDKTEVCCFRRTKNETRPGKFQGALVLHCI